MYCCKISEFRIRNVIRFRDLCIRIWILLFSLVAFKMPTKNMFFCLLLTAGLRIRIQFIRIRIQLQHFRLNTDPDPIRIQGFKDQKLKKKKNFGSKTTIYLSLGLHKESPSTEEAFSSQKRPPNTSKHELFKKISTFVGQFLPSWIRIRISNTDPDPLTRFHPDPQPWHTVGTFTSVFQK